MVTKLTMVTYLVDAFALKLGNAHYPLYRVGMSYP